MQKKWFPKRSIQPGDHFQEWVWYPAQNIILWKKWNHFWMRISTLEIERQTFHRFCGFCYYGTSSYKFVVWLQSPPILECTSTAQTVYQVGNAGKIVLELLDAKLCFQFHHDEQQQPIKNTPLKWCFSFCNFTLNYLCVEFHKIYESYDVHLAGDAICLKPYQLYQYHGPYIHRYSY